MNLLENTVLLIEAIIRKSGIDFEKIPIKFKEIIEEYKTFETAERITLNFSVEWDGLRDGSIIAMLKYFHESIYFAIAYLTADDRDVVTDLEGNPIDKYEVVYRSYKYMKYIKKKLQVVRVLDREAGSFVVKGYMLDLKYANAVVNILDVYSIGRESNLKIECFFKDKTDKNKC